MSSIEERLERDIAAITGGVIVTESDLRNARDEVEGRIDSASRRDRRRTVIAASAAAVVIAVAGVAVFQTMGDQEQSAPPANPAPTIPDPTTPVDPDADYLTGDAPSPQLIHGVWRVDNGTTLLLFGEDGTIRFDGSGTLYSDPVTTGTYEIDGDLITVTTTDDARSECIGAVSAMRASLPELGAVRFVPADSSSGACNPLPSGRGALEQVLPLNFGDLAGWKLSKERGWQPLSDEALLYGVWFAEGGGHVLELDPEGSYYVADESGEPIDSGQWLLNGSELTLTSSVASSECSEGDRVVLGAVEYVDSGTLGMRGTVEENTCGGAWASKGWFLLPHGNG